MHKALIFGVGVLGAVLAGCNSGSSKSHGTAPPPAPTGTPQRFEVVIENLSDQTFLPTSFSAAAWATHQAGAQAFPVGSGASAGLQSLAEDGDPAAFLAELASTPGFSLRGSVGAVQSGQSVRFEVTATPGRDRQLSLATMLGESNDAFVAGTIDLFDAQSAPITTQQQVTLQLYDAGTETNEVPGAGLYQPARQPAPNRGFSEGVLHQAGYALHAFPPAAQCVQLDVRVDGAELVFTLTNAGRSTGLESQLSPVFFASHTASWQAFTPGQLAPASGLTSLAEDGDTAPLVAFAGTVAAIGSHGASAVTLERPGAPPGPASPGERFEVRVTPEPAFPRLTLLAMIMESNDAFVGFGPGGLELFDAGGALRSAAELQAEARRSLKLWDAGSEDNEVPGAGGFQPLRQPGPNTGPADSDPNVRAYADSTNVLWGSLVALGVIDVRVANGPTADDLTLTLTNTSTGLTLTSVVIVFHQIFVHPIEGGLVASAGLRRLAEDGDASLWVSELNAMTDVSARVATVSLAPGQSHQEVITPSANPNGNERSMSVVGRIGPLNDTFFAPTSGAEITIGPGFPPRDASQVEFDLRREIIAWDAGSEANEVGAAGPAQAPRQAAGGAEGNGFVRPFADPVWSYPATDRLIRVTVRPLP